MRSSCPGLHEQVGSVDLGVEADALEAAADHVEVVDAGVADAEVSPGRRGERHEASDLDVVGADAVLGAAQLVAAVDGHHVRADAVDLRAHLHEQAGEILDVRLRRGVLKGRRPGCQRGGHEGVLGAHHGRLVHEDCARLEPAGGRGDVDHARARDLGAHVDEGIEVRVEAPAADEVAAGRGHVGLAEAGQERAGEEERGADPGREGLVGRDVGDARGLEAKLVVGAPFRLHPEALEDRDLGLGIADSRHVREADLLVGEQARGEDRQARRSCFPQR